MINMYALPRRPAFAPGDHFIGQAITSITKEEKWEEAGDKALRQAERDRRRFKESASLLLNSYKERVKRPTS